MKLDILVIAAHPDDAELAVGGTIIHHVSLGKTVGVVDLTRGEMGTRGTSELREQEAAKAAGILGLTTRENLGLKDMFFQNSPPDQLKVVRAIRKYQPQIVITSAITDRHPDHGRASQLVSDACFIAGLRKVNTQLEGSDQKEWRPEVVYHYIQDRYIKPDFVMDISAYWDTKMEAIKAFESQFYNPESEEPETYISSPEFLDRLKSRAIELGRSIGVQYAEGFTTERFLGVKNLFDLQ